MAPKLEQRRYSCHDKLYFVNTSSCAFRPLLVPTYLHLSLLCVQGFAHILSDEVKTLGVTAEVIDMKDYDPDDQLADEVRKGERRVGQE